MPDFRIAETAAEHPKLRAAGLAAFGLWAAAGAYAMRELTDGWVPEYWVQTWPAGRRHATALVTVGLWSPEPRQGLPGYRFHDWTDYQRSASKVNDDRRQGRERAKRSRERSGERAPSQPPDVRAESHDSRALTRALTQEGLVGREASGNERADSRNAPRPRCPQHAQLPPDQRIPACGACKQLRVEAEAQAADQAERVADERRTWRERVDSCRLCDDRGMREVGDALARCAHPSLEAVS